MKRMLQTRALGARTSGAAALLLAACTGLAGCAGSALFPGAGATRALFADATLSAQQASEQLVPGVSTQADALALLGRATVIQFDSGHAVWVYRTTPPGVATPGEEFVVLFSPSGVVKKTRARSASGQAASR